MKEFQNKLSKIYPETKRDIHGKREATPREIETVIHCSCVRTNCNGCEEQNKDIAKKYKNQKACGREHTV